jgi:uncharacterized protein YcbX
MAKISLPCDRCATHGKEHKHGKHKKERTAKNNTRQRLQQAHDKETKHGKE